MMLGGGGGKEKEANWSWICLHGNAELVDKVQADTCTLKESSAIADRCVTKPAKQDEQQQQQQTN
jgi:hypothetical protein